MENSLRATIKESFKEWQIKPFPTIFPRQVTARVPFKAFDNILAII
jgi:hypothetical protein